MEPGVKADKPLSIVRGSPLSEEVGQGTQTIPGYLRDVTTRYRDREALVYRTQHGTVRWSYAEVWDRANEFARALMAAGVGKDMRVGILMTNRPEFLAAMFGTALAGGVAVALNTFSTAPELEYLVKASGISLLCFERVVAGKDFAQMLTALEPAIATALPGKLLSLKFPFLRRLVVVERPGGDSAVAGSIESWSDFLKTGASIRQELVDARAATTKPADTGVLFFSSGTTSTPKGILHAHRAVAVQWWRWPRIFSVGNDVRCWTANGFFWSGQFSLVIGVAFSSGGTVVLQSTFQMEEALTLMDVERVTLPVASPHQWARLEAASNYDKVDLSSLKYFDRKWAVAKQPTISPERGGWRMPISYGTTETLTINCSFLASTPIDERPRGSYGKPLPGNILKIVDPITGEVVPVGERGEIALKGPTLMVGYLGKTLEESFDGEGFYRTGDGGYVDEEGHMFFEGRLSDIIKTGGANVSPLEIDEAIRTYPGVKVTQTVGVPHDTLGEMVVACIVPHDGASLEEDVMREYLKMRLASYKIPRRILFFRDEELSLTGSAKVKAGVLRELAAKKLSGQAQAGA